MIESKNLSTFYETKCTSGQQPACDIQSEILGIESLNNNCFCISLDSDALKRELEMDPETHDLYPLILEKCPHLFAAMPVFVSRHHLDRMAAIVSAAQTVIALPAFREVVLEWAPKIAHYDAGGTQGVFLSYDFHISGKEPKLIEINTNAGGALLSAILARAQRACCPAVADMTTSSVALEALHQTFFTMFFAEWRLARGERDLRRIAIVDDNPHNQYLYPEFMLFQQLFRQHGVDAVIVDPMELQLHDGVLWHGEAQIDLVYNRLTDFTLEEPEHTVLREAYLNNAIVLTPHPRAHALYANKRNFAVLTHPERLRSLGVSEDIVQTLLSGIPRTEIVDPADAERLWSERRKLFFKPAAGFGSRAAYRGDKLTKRVWGEILAGDYIAQALVPPGERLLADHQLPQALKFDVRNFVYDGDVQFITARLYQGQTTNFRTPRGGFAPVFTDILADSEQVREAM
ncbi:MAG: hypothetical protein Q8R74_03330 [Methylophilus sp.]|nr:hypothetical protein [Methylophilus sp.]